MKVSSLKQIQRVFNSDFDFNFQESQNKEDVIRSNKQNEPNNNKKTKTVKASDDESTKHLYEKKGFYKNSINKGLYIFL
jgi:hypothetical protein